MESKYYVVAQAHAAIHYDTFSKLLCGGRVLLCVLPLVLDDLRSWIQRSLNLVKETSSTAVSTMPTSTLPRLEAKTLSQSHHLFLAAQRLLTVVIAAIFGVSKAHRCRRYALISRVQLEWCSQYPCCEARPFPLDYGSFQDGTAYRCWLIPAHNKWRRRLYITPCFASFLTIINSNCFFILLQASASHSFRAHARFVLFLGYLPSTRFN